MKNIFLIILALNYIVISFCNHAFVQYLFSTVTLLVFTLSMASVRGPTRVFSFILTLIGVGLFIANDISVLGFLSAIGENAYLVALYVGVLLLGIPLNIGNYQKHFNSLFEKFANGRFRLYCLSSISTYVLSLVINIGAQYIITFITNPTRDNVSLIGKAITRGSTCAIYWAPSMMALPIILGATHISYVNIFPYAFVLSLVNLGICLCLEYLVLSIGKQNLLINKNPTVSDEYKPQKIYEFVAANILIVVLIMLILSFTELDIFTVIILVSLFVTVGWSLALKKHELFLIELKVYAKGIFPKIKNETALFLSAGFLGAAIKSSGFANLIPDMLLLVSGENSLAFIFCILVVVFLVSLVGIHPIVPIVAFLSSIEPAIFGLTDLAFALLCLLGWCIGSSVSPLSGNNITAAGVLKVSPFKIAYKWNLLFSCLTLIILGLLLGLLNGFI